MLHSYQSGTAKRVSPVLTFLLGSITAVSISCSCLADPIPSPASAGTDWTPPGTSPLGSMGEIRVPSGFKFLNAQAARAYLQQHNQAAPRHLLGLLAPSAENWVAVLQLSDQGYVQHPAPEALDKAELLKRFSAAAPASAKAKAAATPSAKWLQEPKYDAQAHTLQWAVQKHTDSGDVVVQTMQLLCRQGSLDATVISGYRGFDDLAPLNLLVKDFALKTGERYEDYQNGDKVCSAGLAALVKDTTLTTETKLATAATGTTARTLWLGGSAAACALVFSGIWFYVRANGRKPRRNHAPERPAQAAVPPSAPAAEVKRPTLISTSLSAPAPAPASVTPARPSVQRPVLKPQPAAKRATPAFHSRTEALRKPLNGKSNGSRRRKVFDYNRYFTDLMGAVSAHSQMDPPAANGVSLEPSRLPVTTNGVEHSPVAVSSATVDQHAELLASQRELIEEQKRLIQEQNKLIEEKTRLIAEKNELLKLQTQFMADKLV